MIVETYESEEVSGISEQEASDAIETANRIGLPEQARAYSAIHATDTRVVFREMTNEEAVVFCTLFPEQTELDKFRHPIPLRALKAIEVAKSLKADDSPVFVKIVILHTKDIKADPIAIGIRHEKASWGGNIERFHLIARWGDALDEWPAMVKEFTRIASAKCKRLAAEVEAMRQVVESGDTSILSAVGLYGFSPSLHKCGIA